MTPRSTLGSRARALGSRSRALALGALALAGCGWNHLPHQASLSYPDVLWDASNVVATVDGLYVRLPQAGAVTVVRPGAASERIDVGEGRVTRIEAAPDGETVVAFVERFACPSDDPKVQREVERPEDCPQNELEVTTSFVLLSGGAVIDEQPLSGAYNQLTFTRDGRFGVAYLDLSQSLQVDSVLNLTSVVVVDLQDGQSQLVPVGFAADRVLFVEDPQTGAALQAVVVSRNTVALVDLTTSPPQVDVTFPLTLDPDAVVDPVGVDLTPDGRYVLLSARGSSDLYVIDLEVRSINIVELTAQPSAMAVNRETDRTVLVYPNATAEIVEHRFFDTEPVPLDEPATRIETIGDQALLWSANGGHDVVRVDPLTANVVEYRLQNPAVSMHLAPTGEFALALTRPEGGGGTGVDELYDRYPGMEVVDLRTDRSEPFVLEGQGLGVAFAASDDGTSLNALVLQQEVDYLFRLDLYTREVQEIELDAPAVAIGAMPDGTFFITHERALGLVSFLDPASGEITTAAGFAADGLLDAVELVDGAESAEEG